ncbi:MAG: hypothetical protein HKL92_10775 [Candidatus Eremiobacteraeota bacterium]|nr:hypothetical protein [Candidatus Eremiobacteraeota bacterium]NNM93812.1 hypothetical protein [Candidatus Eremiobacteraeota bacterium]
MDYKTAYRRFWFGYSVALLAIAIAAIPIALQVGAMVAVYWAASVALIFAADITLRIVSGKSLLTELHTQLIEFVTGIAMLVGSRFAPAGDVIVFLSRYHVEVHHALFIAGLTACMSALLSFSRLRMAGRKKE